MDVFYGVRGVRRGKGEGERVGGRRKERGRRRRREGKEGEYYHTVQVAEGSSKKSSMPDLTIS